MLKSEIQHQFWVTKKAVQRKLGSKEDENIVASDGELDSKIELFRSVAESCSKLYRIIDQYQERVCILAQEENSLGKFLREVSKESPTTGKMMSTTGKSISYCGQQRIAIRVPLLRLHHDVHTFKGRAIADTHHTIQLMEKERTEYRAALSWMKSVSIQLDPDTGRGLEKFRKAQRHVKAAKTKFDKYTLDCLEKVRYIVDGFFSSKFESGPSLCYGIKSIPIFSPISFSKLKIDLLAAARCNMFSHALVGYQNAILQFSKKTDETYNNTLKNLAKDPHYNFSILKELTQANLNEVESDTRKILETSEKPLDEDQMLFFKDEYKDDLGQHNAEKSDAQKNNVLKEVAMEIDALLSGVPELNLNAEENRKDCNTNLLNQTVDSAIDLLGLSLDDEFSDFMSAPAPFLPSTLLTNSSFNDSREFDLASILSDKEAMQHVAENDEQPPENSVENGKSSDKTTAIFSTLLNSFTRQSSSNIANANTSTNDSLPSKCRDTKLTKDNKTPGKDLSGWYQLFAELDPLSNPDAIPSKTDAPNNSMAA